MRNTLASASQRFGPIDVAYDRDVLAPRPWTIAQADWAIDLLGRLPEGPVLELCSGVGQIGLAVAATTGRRLVQVDASLRASELARQNAAACGVHADVRTAELTSELRLGRRFVLVLADPPYIPSAEVDRYPDDPTRAIDGGPDGLAVARRCMSVAEAHLATGGLLLIQLWNLEQADRLAREMTRAQLLVPVEARSIDGAGALLLARSASTPPLD